MGLDQIIKWVDANNIHKGLVVAFFIFGNIGLAIVLSTLCYILKPIKILYNTLSAISAGALMATFINLLFLGILLCIDITTEIILYGGLFISIVCYAFCLHYADRLWKIGKMYKKP